MSKRLAAKLPILDLNYEDMNSIFLHYTSSNNLESISENGLVPKIGKNSKGIEKTEKIFFCVGANGFLMIMDVWLKWLAVQTNVPKWFYQFGCWWLQNRFTPKIFSTIYIKSFQNMHITKKRSRKVLKKILDESVILVLDLEEGQDFSYDDIDEAKDTYEINSAIKFMYPNEERFSDNKLEYWNMHTFSRKTIPTSKISVLKMNGSTKANDILKYLIEQNLGSCERKYPLLFEYYKSL